MKSHGADQRHNKTNQQFRLEIQRPDHNRARENRRYVPEIRRHRHQRHILHEDRKPHGGEHDHQMRLVQGRLHYQPVNDRPEQEHGRHDGDQAPIGIEAEHLSNAPSTIHREHQEFAMSEIDHPKHAEHERKPDAHQGIYRADQNAG